MKKLGLEEVSSNKNEKDDRFLVRQLAERVPLSFWSEFYDCPPEKAASKLSLIHSYLCIRDRAYSTLLAAEPAVSSPIIFMSLNSKEPAIR